jgi:hypothetical protein
MRANVSAYVKNYISGLNILSEDFNLGFTELSIYIKRVAYPAISPIDYHLPVAAFLDDVHL